MDLVSADLGPLFGLFLIPAAVGAVAGLVYWLAAGRPGKPSGGS